jgi:hypothetical protein
MASEVVTKSDFALLTKVTRSRVSQWIKEKKIGPEAIVGTGRGAKINARIAVEQLSLRLDIDQRYGLNGLKTTLKLPAEPPDGYGYAAALAAELGVSPKEAGRIAEVALRLFNETIILVEDSLDVPLNSDQIIGLLHQVHHDLSGRNLGMATSA